MSYAIAEYQCPLHGRFEAMVERPIPDDAPCECGVPSPWVISAPLGRAKIAEAVTRAKSDPHRPNQLDTRPLADGMPYAEWRAKEAKKDLDARRQQNRSRVA